MKDFVTALVALVLCFWITFVLSACFINATPPGGVSWPYYVFLLLLPLIVFRVAKHLRRAVIPFLYGLVSGYFFAFPVFVDSRTGLRLAAGMETELEIDLKIFLLAFVMATLCLVAYGGRMKRL